VGTSPYEPGAVLVACCFPLTCRPRRPYDYFSLLAPPRVIGQTISHYRIVGMHGLLAGGDVNFRHEQAKTRAEEISRAALQRAPEACSPAPNRCFATLGASLYCG
jgi:hypothetical protein